MFPYICCGVRPPSRAPSSARSGSRACGRRGRAAAGTVFGLRKSCAATSRFLDLRRPIRRPATRIRWLVRAPKGAAPGAESASPFGPQAGAHLLELGSCVPQVLRGDALLAPATLELAGDEHGASDLDPELEIVTEAERVANQLKEISSIHWHGLVTSRHGRRTRRQLRRHRSGNYLHLPLPNHTKRHLLVS